MSDRLFLPGPLVSTQWLADHLGADNLLVLDATVLQASAPHGGYVTGDERYLLEGHIPGALFADLIHGFSDPDSPLPFTRPSLDRFADAAGALGVDGETTVVIYDAVSSQWASRLWWQFRAAGHERVAVLDGGLGRWRAEGRDLERGHVEPSPASFAAVDHPELWAEKDEVERVVAGSRDAALVCGLSSREFRGAPSGRPRAGHIPGSVNVPVSRLLDREDGTYLSDAALREAFGPALSQVDPLGGRVIVYCAGGIAAAADALALTLLGETDVALYDGSLNEWSRDPEAALVGA